jgi:hypothetical protein
MPLEKKKSNTMRAKKVSRKLAASAFAVDSISSVLPSMHLT